MTRARVAVTLIVLSFGVLPCVPASTQGQCHCYLDNYRYETAYRCACPFVDGCMEVREHHVPANTIDTTTVRVDLRGRAVIAVLEDQSDPPRDCMSHQAYYRDGSYEPACANEAYVGLSSEVASSKRDSSPGVATAGSVDTQSAREQAVTYDSAPRCGPCRYDYDHDYDYDYDDDYDYAFRRGCSYDYGYRVGSGHDDHAADPVSTQAESSAGAVSPARNRHDTEWERVWASGYDCLTSLRDAVAGRERIARAVDRLDEWFHNWERADLRTGLGHLATMFFHKPTDLAGSESDANVFFFAFELDVDMQGVTASSPFRWETPWLVEGGVGFMVEEHVHQAEPPTADAEAIGLDMARDTVSAVFSIDRRRAVDWVTQTWGRAAAIWAEFARRLKPIDRRDVATVADDDGGTTSHR